MKKRWILILIFLVIVYSLVDHFYLSNYPVRYKKQISSLVGTDNWEVSDKEVKSTSLLRETVTRPNYINTYSVDGAYNRWFIDYTRNNETYSLQLNNLTSKYNSNVSDNENFAMDVYDELIYLSKLEVTESISKYFDIKSFEYSNPKYNSDTEFGVRVSIEKLDNLPNDFYESLYKNISDINLKTFTCNDILNIFNTKHYIQIEICTSNNDSKYLTEIANRLAEMLVDNYGDKANFIIDFKDIENKHILSLFGYKGEIRLIDVLDESYSSNMYKRQQLYKESVQGLD